MQKSSYMTKAVAAVLSIGAADKCLADDYVLTGKEAIVTGISPLEQAIEPSKLGKFLDTKVAIFGRARETPDGALSLLVDHDYKNPDGTDNKDSANTQRLPIYDMWADATGITSIHHGGQTTSDRYGNALSRTLGEVIVGKDMRTSPAQQTPIPWGYAYVADLSLPDGKIVTEVVFKVSDRADTQKLEFKAVARLLVESTANNMIVGAKKITGMRFDGEKWELVEEDIVQTPPPAIEEPVQKDQTKIN